MCFLIHQKDVNTPSDEPQNCCPSLYMQNEWSLDKFGETMLMAAEASLYSANRRARNCDTKPHECPKPHKATDNWRSKVLGFLSQLHEMQYVGLHSQRVLGFRCSKSPALIPEEREYQGAGARGIRKNQNNLK